MNASEENGLPAAFPCPASAGKLFLEQVEAAERRLLNCLDIDPDIRGGVPVIKGTRIPLSRVFADLRDGDNLEEIADDYELDPELLRMLFDGLATYLATPPK